MKRAFLLVTLDTSVCFGPDSNINRRVSTYSIRGFDKIDYTLYLIKYSSQRPILSAAASGYLSRETQISVVTTAIWSNSVVISALVKGLLIKTGECSGLGVCELSPYIFKGEMMGVV